ncbi:MAG TPA: ribonuclease III domain-containing protein [Candidatus Bathyarchaeia archaeon]
MTELAWLEERLRYSFQEPELLRRALIHPSAKGSKDVTAEDVAYSLRLSWLGDSVLDMVVSEKLWSLLPNATKDELHHSCVGLTNNRTLGRVAAGLGLEEGMAIGKSVKQDLQGKDKHMMLAGALEAVFGAIFLDGGIQKARATIRRVLDRDFETLLEHTGESGA